MNRSAWTSALLLGGAVAYYGLFGRVHVAEIAARQQQTTEAYARYEAAEQRASQETALHGAATRLDALRAELAPALTLDSEAPPELQLIVMNELRADGLVVERTEAPQSDASLGRPNQRVRVTIQGPLPRIVAAMCRVENAATPTRVVELTLQATDPNAARGELTVVRTWSHER
jgi:hypothetical protein